MSNDAIIEELALYAHDPLAFVLFAFPWGVPGTELEKALGPEDWQVTILSRLRDGLLTIDQAIRLATTSGHGIGKSALVAWLILWGVSTFEDTIGVVTANTETQLKTKTWTQLAKWFRLFIGNELFEMTATKLCSRDPAHKDTWRVDLVPWSERNTEAFAGLHNKGKRILLVFDEASAIPDVIWEVSEGALTDEGTEIIWAVFGNPTRNKGRFRECFFGGRFAARWSTIQVDSREVSLTNKSQINEWIKDYGEDSDFVRVRVRGVFPRVDAESFIGYELAMSATSRTVVASADAIIIGVDVGRFGDDPSVIYPRKGRDGVSFPVEILYGADTMKTAAVVASTFLRLRASSVMVDSGGVGGGVVDRLRQLQIPVLEVDFGSKPDGADANDGTKYANKRAEIWGRMRTWLGIGSIPARIHGSDMTLVEELTSPTYDMPQEKILLESKKTMRARGVKSTNIADALACTFAFEVYHPSEDERSMMPPPITPDYNPFAKELF
jgi:hypothetical protein